MTNYPYGTFSQFDLERDEDDDRYLYSLRQFVMMRRCRRPFTEWREVMDYAMAWFTDHPELDPDERNTYQGWAGTPKVWVY